MNACITRETIVFEVFRRVFHSSLKLELCRHACRRRDPIISTCRYGKNMPTTALDTFIGDFLPHTALRFYLIDLQSQISLPNFAFFTVKSHSVTQRTVSLENAFKKSKNPSPFLCKTTGSNLLL